MVNSDVVDITSSDNYESELVSESSDEFNSDVETVRRPSKGVKMRKKRDESQ